MRTPSIAFLDAILRPAPTGCLIWARASSTGRNLTGLDKLHRRQKQAIREERLASVQRARTNPDLKFAPRSIASTTSSTSPEPSSASPPTITPSNLAYSITRTRIGQQLPVYNLAKGGGTKHLTKLRKVSGDLHALKADLTTALGLTGGLTNRRGEKVDGVTVNWQTRHIIVRGWRGAEVKAWAESAGF